MTTSGPRTGKKKEVVFIRSRTRKRGITCLKASEVILVACAEKIAPATTGFVNVKIPTLESSTKSWEELRRERSGKER
jgi:hypothetical protein